MEGSEKLGAGNDGSRVSVIAKVRKCGKGGEGGVDE